MRNVPARLNSKVFTFVLSMGMWALASPVHARDIEAERVIDLEGTTNTRFVGGYATGDLRMLGMGPIIRSENLYRLTEDDFRKLEELGLKTVIDLRSQKEHDQKPTAWQGDNPPTFHHFPIGDADGKWFRAQSKLMKKRRFSEDESLAHMVEGYRVIAEESEESYAKLMDVVLDESNWPVLIHCNAGKDRAGIATTLILEALDVDRQTIMDEYLLTNEVGRSAKKAELMAAQSKKYSRNGRGVPAEAWYPIVGVHSDMLEMYYATIEARYGSMDAYLEELGVDEQDRIALSDALAVEQAELVMGD